MKSLINKITIICLLFLLSYSVSHATPSTIIWIPSVDIQTFKVFHFGVDNYFTAFKKGIGEGGVAFPTAVGLTVGFLPFDKVQAEVGIDLFEPTSSPWQINAKIAIPEGAVSDWAPAIAVGVCNVGFEKNVTDYNLFYAIAAKSLPVIGRISAGYYSGNKNLLTDLDGKADNTGILLSWDRQISEINENLWLAVDYQSGKNGFGAFSYGFAWSFSKNVTVIFARNIFNNNSPSTFTTQLDINI